MFRTKMEKNEMIDMVSASRELDGGDNTATSKQKQAVQSNMVMQSRRVRGKSRHEEKINNVSHESSIISVIDFPRGG